MYIKISKLSVFLSIFILNVSAYAQKELKTFLDKSKSDEWNIMLDKDLSQWEVWTGVPDVTLKNLPITYKKEANGDHKQPIGLGDPMGVFKVVENENQELVLNISGEVYAGLTSKSNYSNYHMTLLFKWGDKKYAPRLERKRDNGLLYHCHGDHGAFWNVWKSCLEYQIQEGDFGDLYNLAGTASKVKVNENDRWDPNSTKIKEVHAKRSVNTENPHGEWNRIDLYVIDDQSIHVTNGEVVLALTNAIDSKGEKLSSGQIQIQSEGAECYMKDIHIRPISKFPKKIKDFISHL